MSTLIKFASERKTIRKDRARILGALGAASALNFAGAYKMNDYFNKATAKGIADSARSYKIIRNLNLGLGAAGLGLGALMAYKEYNR